MKTIYAFFRQLMKMPDYYVGTTFWALGVLLSEIGKAKANLRDSGMLSEDTKEPRNYNMLALLLMGIAFVIMLKIIHKHRKFFTQYHPSSWDFGVSFTWAGIKFTIVVLLTMVPGILYVWRNLQQIMIDPTQAMHVVGNALMMQAIFLPLWLVVGVGSVALAISRGTAYRVIRDSFWAFRAIWKQALLGLFLMSIPTLLLFPIRFLSMAASSLEYVAIVLNVFAAPYSFGIMCCVYLYLAKLLSERAPALAHAKRE